jgi:hypothetical protein
VLLASAIDGKELKGFSEGTPASANVPSAAGSVKIRSYQSFRLSDGARLVAPVREDTRTQMFKWVGALSFKYVLLAVQMARQVARCR